MTNANSGNLYIAWAIVVAFIFVGAFCLVEHGNGQRLVVPPDELTPQQIDELESEIIDMMIDAGWPQEKIDCVKRRFDCEYRSKGDRCDELPSCANVGFER